MTEFDLNVDRTGMDTVKYLLTPEVIKDAGVNSLWGAEFDFPTAPFVVDAIVEWAKKGLYAYTLVTDNFRNIVQNWMRMHRNWEIQKDWIVPTYGISISLATAMRAFTNPGDGIISMDPGYHNYWKAVELGGRQKVHNKLIYKDNHYIVDWVDLELKMKNSKNKLLVVCNPHNPTGKVFNEEELSRIGKMAADNNVIIFNDEIFAECIYDDKKFVTIDQVFDGANVITATSLGKWLSFTGTNQANIIIKNDDLREAFLRERDKEFYGSMNPIMLPAYKAAYTQEGEKWLSTFMKYIKTNYQLVCKYYSMIKGFTPITPEGTFIMWTDATEFCNSETELMDFLVNKAKFHVDPALQYNGEEGFFRINLAMPRDRLEINLESLINAVRGR
jgi:cystathionine beta-lyase